MQMIGIPLKVEFILFPYAAVNTKCFSVENHYNAIHSPSSVTCCCVNNSQFKETVNGPLQVSLLVEMIIVF